MIFFFRILAISPLDVCQASICVDFIVQVSLEKLSKDIAFVTFDFKDINSNTCLLLM